MKAVISVVVLGVWLGSVGSVQAQTESVAPSLGNYGAVQVGWFNKQAAVGVELGQRLTSYVGMYLSTNWQQDAPSQFASAVNLTTGVKVGLPIGSSVVRPYVLGGLGIVHFRPYAPEDGPVGVPVEGVNRFLTEIGGGVAFGVGRNGYVDLGYKFVKPYDGTSLPPQESRMAFKTNAIVAAFGFRY
ncbi:MAG: hypothetical protein C5B54_05760 [Acidobacteria bacterium]|nr:MAG: hypothetical protein C5B54_05760 [Acidobacteriota bacterium]